MPDFKHNYPIDQIGVVERIQRFNSRSIKKETKLIGLKLALSMIDLTTLDGRDSEVKVRKMCLKALNLKNVYDQIDTVAAICVYPSMVKTAKNELLNSSIKLGSSLEESLTSSGWLPKSMKPFIQSAQKVNNLPWALTEIGNQRLRLASLFAQRFSLVVFPLLMLLLGAMIGFIAIAMFMPLIKMIVELS